MLAVTRPGEDFEQNAARLSSRVLQMPEPDVQPAPPPILGEVLSAPGQPLDPATRDFMERRLGHDFGPVRVHTDAKAAESARAVNALAYTVGRDIAFGTGRYAPRTSEGRRLVAHELAHVVQQAAASILQRSPDKPTAAESRRLQELEEMARHPGQAHRAWKGLSRIERIQVFERMRRLYGGPFAQQFLQEAAKGKPQIETTYWQPGSGPTPGQLIARGFRLAEMENTGTGATDVEIWVHPSGRVVRRDVSTYKVSPAEPEEKGKAGGKAPPTVQPPIEDKPPGKPPRPPPPDEIAIAMEHLANLHSWNAALHASCTAAPFDIDVVEDAQINWDFARESLRAMGNLDMRAVYPDFWKDVAEATAENRLLRAQCCKKDPSSYFLHCDEL